MVLSKTSTACLAQLLKDMSSLPEDLALHYFHQSLGALEHLHHRKVLHLDVKGMFLTLSLQKSNNSPFQQNSTSLTF